MKSYKILINCYACSPFRGSEPGMGWNFIKCLVPYHEIHVITELKWKSDIQDYKEKHPQEFENLHFYFIERSRYNTLRKIWPPSYYWFYKEWQKKALRLAQELDQKINFDLVHQLNMIGFREPGYLWKMNKPFVWGPIGGFNITNWKMLSSMGTYGMVFYYLRNVLNLHQIKHNKRVKQAIANSSALFSATRDDKKTILRKYYKQSTLLTEVGYTELENFSPEVSKRDKQTFKIAWAGIHEPRKSLNLLIEALSKVPDKCEVEVHILGKGSCTEKWKKLAKDLKVDNLVWHGHVKREDGMKILNDSHIFVITSLSDATSTVLLEALSFGLPVIALNHCGFANVITRECGIKINIHSHLQVVEELSKAIMALYYDDTTRVNMGEKAIERAKEYSWDKKAELINQTYEKIIK